MNTIFKFTCAIATFFFAFNAPVVQAAQANAAAQAVATCDALAAHPSDKAKPAGVAGVAYADLDGSSAKAACEKAVLLAPSPRMHCQLGRAYEVLGDTENARKHLAVAVEARYVKAFALMGGTYDSDEADNPEGATAFVWYKLGAELGDEVAMFNVATCLYRGHCAEENVEQALVWYKKSAAAGYQDAHEWVEILTEELAE